MEQIGPKYSQHRRLNIFKEKLLKFIKIFQFVTVPSFVAWTSCNTSDPIFLFVKMIEKNVTKDNLRDRFGSEIFPGECYLKEISLQKE